MYPSLAVSRPFGCWAPTLGRSGATREPALSGVASADKAAAAFFAASQSQRIASNKKKKRSVQVQIKKNRHHHAYPKAAIHQVSPAKGGAPGEGWHAREAGVVRLRQTGEQDIRDGHLIGTSGSVCGAEWPIYTCVCHLPTT